MPSLFVSMRLTKGLKLVGILTALSLAAVYSAGVRLEARDSFCASCHVEPEGRYYRQSRSPGEMITLAASHARERTRCIDCHSRNWIPGRLWA